MSGTLTKEHVVTPHSLKAQPNVERESTAADVAVKPSKRPGRRWGSMAVAAVATLTSAAGG